MARAPLWPARVDLLIRSYVSDTFFLLEMLFDSIEQLWPRGIGDVILVLDEDNQIVEDIVPTWIKVYYEKNYLKLPGKILQQWSYLWADNYTTAPYIAIIDDDVIFNLKVTPGLLFNLTDESPYVIGSRQKQMNHWVPSTHYFVGKPYYLRQLHGAAALRLPPGRAAQVQGPRGGDPGRQVQELRRRVSELRSARAQV
ncbi:hypothetical protein CLOP_g13505 [Closterium sp. NIES-67]|nr:hypothetical protein CLOP_g13505 [Closterium sp. NIES-67]